MGSELVERVRSMRGSVNDQDLVVLEALAWDAENSENTVMRSVYTLSHRVVYTEDQIRRSLDRLIGSGFIRYYDSFPPMHNKEHAVYQIVLPEPATDQEAASQGAEPELFADFLPPAGPEPETDFGTLGVFAVQELGDALERSVEDAIKTIMSVADLAISLAQRNPRTHFADDVLRSVDYIMRVCPRPLPAPVALHIPSQSWDDLDGDPDDTRWYAEMIGYNAVLRALAAHGIRPWIADMLSSMGDAYAAKRELGAKIRDFVLKTQREAMADAVPAGNEPR
jgi:hypothetical protein